MIENLAYAAGMFALGLLGIVWPESQKFLDTLSNVCEHHVRKLGYFRNQAVTPLELIHLAMKFPAILHFPPFRGIRPPLLTHYHARCIPLLVSHKTTKSPVNKKATDVALLP